MQNYTCIKINNSATVVLLLLSGFETMLIMKKNITAVAANAILVSSVFLFSSCFKDKCTRNFTITTPVYTKLTDLRAAVKSEAAAPLVNAGKLYVYNNWIFLNELNKGIHVIDNSNPAKPVKVSFINIPGNVDMHVKGSTLYADLYCDLLAVNIQDPKNISVAKYLTNTFPDKASYTDSTDVNSIRVITSYTQRDTAVDCESISLMNDCISCSALPATAQFYAAATKSTSGMAGSMARFASVSNYMYAVTTHDLNVIDISNAPNPLFVKKKNIGWDVETIFPFDNKLYIGAGSSMSVYDVQDPVNPQQLSWSGHWCSMDPVVADGKYAYVTLHEANICGNKTNQLEVYDLSTPNTPNLVKTYQLTRPQGLSKDGNLLFICDDGLKIYDASNVSDLKLIKQLPATDTYDVIAGNGIAYVVSKDGLSQYDYSDRTNIHLISRLLK